MEYFGHREVREERGEFSPVAWVGLNTRLLERLSFGRN